MKSVRIKSLSRIRIVDAEGNEFEFCCIDGRLKWTDENKIISIKARFHSKTEIDLHSIEMNENSVLIVQAVSGDTAASFHGATLLKNELRSGTINTETKEMLFEYFMEFRSEKPEFLDSSELHKHKP